MSAYAYINGMISCENELSIDITKSFRDLIVSDEYWHRNGNEDYLFSLSIKECILWDFFKVLETWKEVKTKDSVLEEWYPIEVSLLIKYESDSNRIDCIDITDQKISNRKTIEKENF